VASIDDTFTPVGRSNTISFDRIAEFRLLKTLITRFVTYTSAQPISTATEAGGRVAFNGSVLAFEIPKDNPPATVDITLTYADGSSEVVTVTV
jgi:hypothetical protein